MVFIPFTRNAKPIPETNAAVRFSFLSFITFVFSYEQYHWFGDLWFILWLQRQFNGDLVELYFRRISQKVENSFTTKGRHKQAFGGNVAGCSH